jgi:hypothetical protein
MSTNSGEKYGPSANNRRLDKFCSNDDKKKILFISRRLFENNETIQDNPFSRTKL